MDWLIYYGDGSTYCGEPEHAPALDVQAVAWNHPEHGRQVVHGRDFYWWTDDGWYGGDIFGLWDHLAHIDGWAKVIFGRSIPTDGFRAIVERALTEEF